VFITDMVEVTKMKLVLAHFNKNELGDMDQLQGGREIYKNGIPMYAKLSQMMKEHPAMEEHLAEMFQAGIAHKQGIETPVSKHLKKLAEDGRFGDTEIAYIPEDLSKALDHIIGGEAPRNPKDGHKEYFLGTLASLAAPMLMPVAGNLIGGLFGGLGRAISGFGSGGQQQYGGYGMQQMPQQQYSNYGGGYGGGYGGY